ncbi:MAG TPA: MerR family transcriptional regulator [Paludibacteraceae bacterium]|nr:MerR family transcriptional regulator [Paludibacteraceae bacterium]HPD58870.1 MerR family transcriptional regulator [Paludibacteraceae bacterium]HPL77181.1 MerR family transcriptional regulator [Paludibacteraceae bacterium]HRS24016.1 MerR family transcriptional regulator [Paludibacteraceae bacterium]HRT78095.1 MerR family transcriptional regulator [Paludibacteraceae bacterium]
MEKVYYSISEVAEMLKISPSNLRFWEKEFSQLKPKRSNKGTRTYTKEDIEIIKMIHLLVNEQKLTLQGAKRKLSLKKETVSKQQELVERLQNVRKELLMISKALDE